MSAIRKPPTGKPPNVNLKRFVKPTLLAINLTTRQATRYERSLPGKVACMGIAKLGEDNKEMHATLASEDGRAALETYRKTGRVE